jgi:GNAT superfamily N-acetyltransferase
VRIRPANVDDLPFILDLAPRLTAFGLVPGRDTPQMVARDQEVLRNVLEHSSPTSSVFVAEDDTGRSIGFIHLTTDEDYYTNSKVAHIADIVVTPNDSGRGVGTALMAFAERWANEHGFRMLTLNVFAANRRARDLYAKVGFREEWIRCIRDLNSDPSHES